MTRTAIYQETKDYVSLIIAMASYCIGWTLFLLPNDITTGGLAGVSSILFWGIGIPVHYTYFSVNALLMLVALRILGRKFCVKTIFAVCTLTLMLAYTTPLTAGLHLLRDQPFMAAVLGAVFCGTGVGLGLSSNGSTGGTDIIAALVNKFYDISLGRIILLLDIVVITCSYFVLRDWEKVIYGYVVLIITGYTIDVVVNNFRRSVQFFIVTKKYKEIGHRINQDPHRGCTIINGEGVYSGQQVHILFVLAKKRESAKIFALIREIDPKAFVSQSSVIGVYGEGFDKFKAHL